MRLAYCYIILVMLGLSACNNRPDKPDLSAEATSAEVANGQPINNSDLVNMPVSADTPTEPVKKAKIVFDEPVYVFGTINEGDIVTHDFKFKNTGDAPLQISNAKASCGCTVPEFPKEPIPPGGAGVIKAKFNSEGKSGKQEKSISIMANTYPTTESEIILRGDVVKSPEANAKEVK